jgi:hypothetical protein
MISCQRHAPAALYPRGKGFPAPTELKCFHVWSHEDVTDRLRSAISNIYALQVSLMIHSRSTRSGIYYSNHEWLGNNLEEISVLRIINATCSP